MDNPFITAEWRQTYDLAGAEWKPKLKRHIVGSILIHEERGLIHVEADVYGLIDGDDVGSSCRWEDTACSPLLPSPAWVNTQTNPRAVAIAALERAGFVSPSELSCRFIGIGDASQDTGFTIWVDDSPPDDIEPDERVEIYTADGGCHDPALARYAVNCFDVLHTWAAEINWEAHND